ncbi:MAG: TldD/PmbA family protein, partial [Clostridia bacterium]|nr:TldD/PmbA family protein [Clostridia bacterium]
LPESQESAGKARYLREAWKAARAVDPAVAQVQASLTDSDKLVTICNSQGLLVTDRRVRVRLGVQAVAAENGENQVGSQSPGALCGYELFEGRVDPAQTGAEAARIAVTMLRAPACPAGEMPVAIDGGFGGVIFHEACGHSLEATAVAWGNSEFCGKLGQRIASEAVTAIDDGTIENAWGSINVDDEGTPATRLVLIENGILKNYMVDRLNGRKMGMAPTGNARRESYAYAPTSRMRNTFIAPGNTPDAEILSTMGDGLYARNMGGGSVNPVTGEFNFAVSEGYLVRDGKIAHPVRGATLVGRGSEILMRIDRVGPNLALAPGMCGSVSGSVPVCVGQPMIRVSRMTVGGQQG